MKTFWSTNPDLIFYFSLIFRSRAKTFQERVYAKLLCLVLELTGFIFDFSVMAEHRKEVFEKDS